MAWLCYRVANAVYMGGFVVLFGAFYAKNYASKKGKLKADKAK